MMGEYMVIKVTVDTGQTDVWSAKRGEFDWCGLEGGAFVVKRRGVLAGAYGLAHLVSAVVE